MRRAGLVAAALLLALAGCRSEAGGASGPAVSEAGLELLPVTVASASGTHEFSAEVARTPEQQERGLMHRDSLAPGAAMLFPFSPPKVASFWMENTLIPLDLIFVREDGTIASIAANAVPLSRARLGTPETVAAVLEIAGGRAAELGIAEGDKVSWPGGPAR